MALPKEYFRLRRKIDADMRRAERELVAAGWEFARLFGRDHGLFEGYRCHDATTILVTAGAIGQTAMEAIDRLRADGKRAGAVRLRAVRPFPSETLHRFLPSGARLAVVDRSYSPGSAGGILFQELKAALYPWAARHPVCGYVAGLGGGDITPELLRDVWLEAESMEAPPLRSSWVEEER